MSDDKAKIQLAKKVVNKLKIITKAGAITVSTINGLESLSRAHRYTEGAKKMHEKGVKLLPIAGKYYFKLNTA